jgi:ABC-type spermidine/putrescine transport system permease subunit II
MEEKPRSAMSNGLYYGMIMGGVLIVFSLILFLLDLHMNRSVGSLGYLILAAGMIWGTLDYRKKYTNGFLTYGKAFSSCFWIGLFAGIIGTIYFLIFMTYIHPGYINEAMELARVQMEESRSDLSEEQMEQAMEMSAKFMSPLFMTVMALVMYTIVSAVIGLIAAIFLKKEDPTLKSTM